MPRPAHQPPLNEPHNCLTGNVKASRAHFSATLRGSDGAKGVDAPLEEPLSMHELALALNDNPAVRAATESVMKSRFVFIGILEAFEESVRSVAGGDILKF